MKTSGAMISNPSEDGDTETLFERAQHDPEFKRELQRMGLLPDERQEEEER